MQLREASPELAPGWPKIFPAWHPSGPGSGVNLGWALNPKRLRLPLVTGYNVGVVDPILSLAFSVQTNKGVYALLLGSGLSRSAAIPTGWEVVLDLTRKLAHLKGEDCEPDPAGWYRETFGNDPDYSGLLEAIAKSPAERTQLLKAYFEPTEDEREQGLKVPTSAHGAIAKLVASGYIRVILTTNFDRLLERALDSACVVPTVISTSDAAEGARPFVHNECTLLKLNGDYLDTRLKNSSAELAHYDDRINGLLDRVLEEFGLIVCGWSAEWDIALRSSLERCKTQRFTTYWAARGELKDVARRLLTLRRGQLIRIADADTFFAELSEKVFALEEIQASHPLSTKVAVATLKGYLTEERHRIRVHDLVMREAERLHGELLTPNFSPTGALTIEELARRVRVYEGLSEVLLALVITGVYWGSEVHDGLWVKCLLRIADLGLRKGAPALLDLEKYPALLLLYSTGIASVAAGHYKALVAVLRQAKLDEGNGGEPLALSFDTDKVMGKDLAGEVLGLPGRHTPFSDHIHRFLRGPFRDVLPQDAEYDMLFDRFEYLLALVHLDLKKQRGVLPDWAPVGRFGWRNNIRVGENNIASLIESEIRSAGEEWPPLRVGLFGGSSERARAAKTSVDQIVSRLAWI